MADRPRLHGNALKQFGSASLRVATDNLRAAIIEFTRDDPEVHQSYRECTENYGFLIGHCLPCTPRHKDNVEQGCVHYVKPNSAGDREPTIMTQVDLGWDTSTPSGLTVSSHDTPRLSPDSPFLVTVRLGDC